MVGYNMTYVQTLSAITCGNATTPSDFASAPNNALETIAGADDTDYAYDNNNNSGTTTLYQGYELNNMPSDFISMATLSVRLRYGWAGAFSNRTWDFLRVRITSGSKFLAGGSLGTSSYLTIASSITATTPTNSSNISFVSLDTTATNSDWDAAVLEIQLISTRSGGGSSVQRRIYAAEISGTYNAYRPELKYYTGSTWVWKPLKVYVGGQWVYKTLKRWDGTQWVREP